MAIEKWIAAASLGLFVMFVAEILTIFHYLTNPSQEIEPGTKILEYISISIAPAVILAGISFIMSKRYGSKPIGAMIMIGGVVLLGGMYYANTLLPQISQSYLVTEVTLTPQIFMVVSIPVIITGAVLFKIKKVRPKKEYF